MLSDLTIPDTRHNPALHLKTRNPRLDLRSDARLKCRGAAHRIARKNGDMVCHSSDRYVAEQILIYSSCNQVAELERSRPHATITHMVRETGFVSERQMRELTGPVQTVLLAINKNPEG